MLKTEFWEVREGGDQCGQTDQGRPQGPLGSGAGWEAAWDLI